MTEYEYSKIDIDRVEEIYIQARKAQDFGCDVLFVKDVNINDYINNSNLDSVVLESLTIVLSRLKTGDLSKDEARTIINLIV